MLFSVGGDLELIGGTSGAFAQIGAFNPPSACDIIFSKVGGSVLLQGGEKGSYAAIGHGQLFGASTTDSFIGDIIFTGGIGSNLSLLSGVGGAINFAQIGHFGVSATSLAIDQGNIRINSIGNDVTLYGNSYYALIGHNSGINVDLKSSITGDITLDAIGGNLYLKSGLDLANFAQIGHANGLTTTGNIGVYLDTGSVYVGQAAVNPRGAQGYTLIGHNNFTGTASDLGSSITGNVLVSSTSGDIVLQGGLGFAQIGHPASFSAFGSITGDVTINLPMGALNLFGGLNTNASAVVGHGSYAYFLPSATSFSFMGSINVNASTVLLLGGTGAFADATIGFEGGYGLAGPSFIVPPLSQISVTTSGNITLLGGDGSVGRNSSAVAIDSGNAVIGVFSSLEQTLTTVTIDPIQVTSTGGDITLAGGNNGSLTSGVALIGVASAVPPYVLQSRIEVHAPMGTLSLYGAADGSVSGGSQALIQNQAILTLDSPIVYPFDVSIDAQNVMLRGGSTTNGNGGTALISSGRNVNLQSQTHLQLLGEQGTAQIQFGAGTSNFSTGQNLILQGGTADGSFVRIFGSTMGQLVYSGEMRFSIGGDLQLLGGGGSSSFAQIGTPFPNQRCDINFTQVLGSVTLKGGSNIQTYAAIGNGNLGLNEPMRIIGDITFTGGIGAYLSLTGGGGPSADNNFAFAQIGHIWQAAPLANTYEGNIRINGIGNDVTLSPVGNYALIGHGSTATLGSPFQPSAIVGDISLDGIGGNVYLKQGTFANTFAQIGHNNSVGAISGNISISQVTGNLEIQGGASATSIYSLIGHGGTRAPTPIVSITGDITVDSQGGNITLTGGSQLNNFAQVGHFSATTIAGNVSLNSTGALNLTGGSGNGASAVVGHGNYATTSTNATGIISVSSNSVDLIGGNAGSADATIGFEGILNVMPGSQVIVTSAGNVSLTGGVNTVDSFPVNAVIGFYNSQFGNLTTVIDPIQVTSTGGDITLAGGMTPGKAGGVAIIGSGGAQLPLNCQSRIEVHAPMGTVSLFGAAEGLAAGGGQALIQNQAITGGAAIIYPFDVSIDAQNVMIRGGSTSGGNGGFAQISSGRNVNFQSQTHLELLAEQGTAQILLGDEISSFFIDENLIIQGGTATNSFAGIFGTEGEIQFSIGGDLSLAGGSGTGSFAQIGATSVPTGQLDVNFLQVLGSAVLKGGSNTNSYVAIGLGSLTAGGTPSLTGNITLNGGPGAQLSLIDGSASPGSFAQIGHFWPTATVTGNIRINNIGNDVTLSPNSNYSLIGHGASPIPMTGIVGDISLDKIGGNIYLNMSPTASAFAQIGHTTSSSTISGNISINQETGNIELEGGTAAVANYSVIGHAGIGGASVVGDILIDSKSGDITLTAGSLNNNFVQIGHFAGSSIVGNVTVNSTGALKLVGGGNPVTGGFFNASAVVGHGNYVVSSSNATGAINVSCASAELIGGSLTGSDAIIGFEGIFNVLPGSQVSVTTMGNLSLEGGVTPDPISLSPANAAIGYYTTELSSVTAIIDPIQVTSTGGDITLIGGGEGQSTEGVAIIGTSGLNDSTNCQSRIEIHAPMGTLSLYGTAEGNMTGGGEALIQNLTITGITPTIYPFDILVDAQNVMIRGGGELPAGGGGLAEINAGRNLNLLSQTDLQILSERGIAEIQVGAGTSSFAIGQNLIIQADNSFAGIFGTAGEMQFSIGADLQLTGGSNDDAFAQIGFPTSSVRGDLNFTQVFGSVILQGGSAQNTYALIGNGNLSGLIPQTNIIGDIIFNGGIGAYLSLIGGSQGLNNGFAQIGHIWTSNTMISTIQGNIRVNNLGNDITLSPNGNYALIGHGNPLGIGPASVTGDIGLDKIGGNIYFNSGIAANTFAQVGHISTPSITGNISVSQVTGNLEMLGGSIFRTMYALIGHGGTGAPIQTITGNIIVDSQSGDITLSGGTQPNNFAQIGHFSAATITGDVSLNSTGALNLLGGSGPNASAVVGHGNYTSSPTNTTGVITVSSASANLIAGTGSQADATIGFEGTANVLPGSQIFTTTLDNLSLAGGGSSIGMITSNAVIGYYNIITSNVTAIIDPIQVTSTGGDITLSGGVFGSFSSGTALIGTIATQAPINCQSRIEVNAPTGTLSLLGAADGAASGGGEALIQNQALSAPPTVLYPFDISINAHNVMMRGGTTVAGGGVAEIISGRNVILQSQTYLQLLAEQGTAQIILGEGTSSFSVGQNLIIQAGTITDAQASILSGGGEIDFSIGGDLQLLGGSGLNAFAQIGADSSLCDINFIQVLGNTFIQGGTGSFCYAAIGNVGFMPVGNITFTGGIGARLSMLGGSQATSFAQIGHFGLSQSFTGNIRINSVGNDVILNPGTSYALIGHGSQLVQVDTTIGDISLDAIGGNICLNQQGAQTGFTQIGHMNAASITGNIAVTQATGNMQINGVNVTSPNYSLIGHGGFPAGQPAITTINGDITVNSTGGDITLNGGVQASSFAQIGHFSATTIAGNVSLNSTGALNLFGGTSPGSSAVLGQGNYTLPSNTVSGRITSTSGSVLLTAGSQLGADATIGFEGATRVLTGSQIGVTATGNITVLGGINPGVDGGNGVIGYYDTILSNGNVIIDPIIVTSLGGDIILTGGTAGNTTPNTAIIGTSAVRIPINCQSRIEVHAPKGTLTLYGAAPGQAGGQALIQNASIGTRVPFTYDISIDAQNILLRGSLAGAAGGGTAEIISGRNVILQSQTDLQLIAEAGTAQILVGPGASSFATGQNLLITGGTATNSIAGIFGTNGELGFTIGGDLQLTGGSGTSSFAQIGATAVPTGPLNLNFIQVLGNSFLQGGSSVNSYAAIGIGSLTAGGSPALTGNIIFTGGIGAQLALIDGTVSPGSFAQIGHFWPTASVTGNIRINNVGNDVTLSPNANYSLIGHGNGSSTMSSITGDISLDVVGGNIYLNPGTQTKTFAQIGHINATTIQGNISVSQQTGNLELQGGSNAALIYSLIGHGGTGASTTSITGDINVDSQSGNITLSGGSQSANFVQIGHFSASSITGDVNVNSTGALNLFGGNNSNASAVVGHGNYAVPLAQAIGAIKVSSNTIEQIAGNTAGADATIGFVGVANVLPGSQVSVTTAGNLSLAGGVNTMSAASANAVIGYYNTLQSIVTAIIDPIQVTSTNGDITLAGGTSSTTAGGIAIIGDGAVNASFNCQSRIEIHAPMGTLSLYGAADGLAAGGGQALIQNQDISGGAPVIYPFDISIDTQNAMIRGGSTFMIPGGGTAEIISGRNIILQSQTDLQILGEQGTAQILPGAGASSFTTGQNLLITAGANSTPTGILGTAGTMDFAIGADLQLTGGSSTGAFAQIGSASPSGRLDLNFNQVGGSVTLLGGSAASTYALIGLGGGLPGLLSGDVTFSNVVGDFFLTAGSGSFAHVGVIGNIIMGPITTTSNVTLSKVGGNLILQGGSGDSVSSATIGFGESQSSPTDNYGGSIVVNAASVALFGGIGNDSNAVIGVNGPALFVNMPLIQVTATGDLTLQAQPNPTINFGGNAFIGYLNRTPAGAVSGAINQIQAVSRNGNINLTGGFGIDVLEGMAFIGTRSNPSQSGTLNSNITIEAKGNLSLLGQPISTRLGGGSAVIANNNINIGAVPYDITIGADDILLYGGGSIGSTVSAEIYSARNLNLTANGNLNLLSASGPTLIHSINGDMTFTVGGNVNVQPQFAYAQIGSTGAATVNSSIQFINVGGNVSVIGGTTAGAFAHIGIGGLVSGTFTGDIIFDTVGGSFTVGGSAATGNGAYSQVGHVGVTGTPIIATGDVRVGQVTGALNVIGGLNSNTPAVIGHGNLSSNPGDTYTGQINVRANTIQVNAGADSTSDAVIGFSGGLNVLTPSAVFATADNDITLQGGLPLNGFGTYSNAVIGYINPGSPNVTIDPIQVTTTNGNIILYDGISNSGFQGITLIGTYAASGIAQSTVNVNASNGAVNIFASNPKVVNSSGVALIANNTPSNNTSYNLSIEAGSLLIKGSQSATLMVPPSGITAFADLSVKVSGDVQMLAGLGSAVTINSSTGAMTFDIGENLSLTGGSQPNLYAQIGANFITGSQNLPIHFINIGGNVSITGGSSTNTYAAIGHGRSTPNSQLTSDILFNNIEGDVTLTGGAANSYAQIGHLTSSTPQAITGDIRLLNVAGKVLLQGGAQNNAQACIGIGDPLSNSGDSYFGEIVVNATQVDLFGGSGTGSAALIGFDNSGAATILSDQVGVTALGGVTLTANQSNATIGYYTAVTPTTVLIQQINVASEKGNVTLNGPSAATAAIGTFAAGGTVNSNIKITTPKNILLNGPNATIVNGLMPGPFDIVLDPGSLILLNSNINSMGSIFIAVTERLNLNFDASNPLVLQTTTAQIQAQGDININTDEESLANIALVGGNAVGVAANLISVTGNINIGRPSTTGANNVTLGSASMVGPVNMQAAGSIFANIAGDLNVISGSSPATISATEDLTWNGMGSLKMLGSSQIFTTSGSIDLNFGAFVTIDQTSIIQNTAGTGDIVITAGKDFSTNATSSVQTNADGNIEITTGRDALFTNTSNSPPALQVPGSGLLSINTGRDVSFTNAALAQSSGDILINAARNVSMNGTSSIQNNSVSIDTNLLQVTAGNDITLDATSSIQQLGVGDLLTISGRHTTLLVGASLVTMSPTSTLTVVVDNNFPDPPKYGIGRLNTAPGTSITAAGGSGTIRLFTARQPFNSILGTLSGFTFIPGTQYVDTAQEIWCSYYYRSIA